MKKTFSDIIYNGLYQLFIIIIPIITVPYVSRVLGAHALGIYGYVYSIITFLSVLIAVGMNQLGPKVIAQTNRELRLKRFKQLWFIQFITGLIVIIVFICVTILLLPYKQYFLLEIPFLVGYVLDISWYFIGIGEIKKVVLRNTLIKMFALVLIFLCVHTTDDLGIYVLINSLSILLSNLVFWFSIIRSLRQEGQKDVDKVNDGTTSKMLLHQALILLIPQVAVQAYTSFDSTIVGIISGATQLAFYSQSQNIARVVLAIITSVSVVLMPKMAAMQKKDATEKRILKVFDISLTGTLIISLYLAMLLMVNAKVFVGWFFGNEFTPMSKNMFWVSLIIIFISYGGVFATQYTLSRGLYVRYAIPYIIGAIYSISLNLLLVPKMKSFGGTIVITTTEILVCLIRVFIVKKYLPIWTIFKAHIRYILIFLVTLFVGLMLDFGEISAFYDLVIKSVVVSLVYAILVIIVNRNKLDKLRKILKL
ncbi:oligosaccharide flippase family protein [Loigolactobacillus coryniformis]|uniref:Teichoic acid polysaccharide export protein n=1 Tax=Loigolactobacillus coryniformis subsp. coryniformis KCTC 3167 = DSM 20001 TaxID=913848 RepID=A0A0R1FCB4_9LACO|nr:oligosaccharide flippase family protein [Loigolactobacillus coryniformis]ATO56652.1 teichoic acid transporter [Loigolactobacillus coryniformis subsp. coryniformis KCTC 3167 = DSM 20001]KRK19324.1 teichoic acid polysaccharide export protein [Loigolactobacillus coryniformis subsp. coryniformis KCTC 3167 = DSM 20001]